MTIIKDGNISNGVRYFQVTNCMFRENAQTISSNYTVVGTVNASTVGPVAIASGVTITIETGGTWTII